MSRPVDGGSARTQPRARAPRWLGRLAVMVGTPAVLLGLLWVGLDLKRGHDLRLELAAMEREKLLVPLEELLRSPSDPADNAAALYEEAFAAQLEFAARLKHEAYRALEAYAPDEPEAPHEDDRPWRETRPGSWRPPPAPPPPSPATAQAAREMLRAPGAVKALALLREGSAKPCCVFSSGELGPALVAPGPGSWVADTAPLLPCVRARTYIDAGDPAAATDWYCVALAVCRHLASTPSQWGQQQASRAIRRLLWSLQDVAARAPLSRSQVARLDEMLASTDRVQRQGAALTPRVDLARKVLFFELLAGAPERIGDACLPLWYNGQLRLAARLYYSPLSRPLHRRDQLLYLCTMRAVLGIAGLPYRDTRDEHEALVWKGLLGDRNRFFVDFHYHPSPGSLLHPSIYATHWPWLCSDYDDLAVGRDATSARIRLVRTLLWLRRYKADRGT